MAQKNPRLDKHPSVDDLFTDWEPEDRDVFLTVFSLEECAAFIEYCAEANAALWALNNSASRGSSTFGKSAWCRVRPDPRHDGERTVFTLICAASWVFPDESEALPDAVDEHEVFGVAMPRDAGAEIDEMVASGQWEQPDPKRTYLTWTGLPPWSTETSSPESPLENPQLKNQPDAQQLLDSADLAEFTREEVLAVFSLEEMQAFIEYCAEAFAHHDPKAGSSAAWLRNIPDTRAAARLIYAWGIVTLDVVWRNPADPEVHVVYEVVGPTDPLELDEMIASGLWEEASQTSKAGLLQWTGTPPWAARRNPGRPPRWTPGSETWAEHAISRVDDAALRDELRRLLDSKIELVRAGLDFADVDAQIRAIYARLGDGVTTQKNPAPLPDGHVAIVRSDLNFIRGKALKSVKPFTQKQIETFARACEIAMTYAPDALKDQVESWFTKPDSTYGAMALHWVKGGIGVEEGGDAPAQAKGEYFPPFIPLHVGDEVDAIRELDANPHWKREEPRRAGGRDYIYFVFEMALESFDWRPNELLPEDLIGNPAPRKNPLLTGSVLGDVAALATTGSFMLAATRKNPSEGHAKVFEIQMNGYRQELGRYVGKITATSVLEALQRAEKYVTQGNVVVVTDTPLVGDAKRYWLSIDGHDFEDLSDRASSVDLNAEISRVQGPHRVEGGKVWLLEEPEKAYGVRASWWGDGFEHADELLEDVGGGRQRMRELKKSWWEKKTDADDEPKKNPSPDYRLAHVILESTARTIYALGWAERAEDLELDIGQGDILKMAPPTSDSARRQAEELWTEIVEKNPMSLPAGATLPASIEGIWEDVSMRSGLDFDDVEGARLFGHYIAMESLGHGVAWDDDHEPHELKVPRHESDPWDIVDDKDLAPLVSFEMLEQQIEEAIGAEEAAYFEEGDVVDVRGHEAELGQGLSYPDMTGVTVLEDGRAGSWDVVDIEGGPPDVDSVYSFSIVPRAQGDDNDLRRIWGLFDRAQDGDVVALSQLVDALNYAAAYQDERLERARDLVFVLHAARERASSDEPKENPGEPDLSEVVKALLRKWKMTPQEINNGNCDQFADALAKELGQEANVVYTEDVDPDDELPGHCWVEYKGRVYDAETPSGVSSWEELPIFRQKNPRAPEPDLSQPMSMEVQQDLAALRALIKGPPKLANTRVDYRVDDAGRDVIAVTFYATPIVTVVYDGDVISQCLLHGNTDVHLVDGEVTHSNLPLTEAQQVGLEAPPTPSFSATTRERIRVVLEALDIPVNVATHRRWPVVFLLAEVHGAPTRDGGRRAEFLPFYEGMDIVQVFGQVAARRNPEEPPTTKNPPQVADVDSLLETCRWAAEGLPGVEQGSTVFTHEEIEDFVNYCAAAMASIPEEEHRIQAEWTRQPLVLRLVLGGRIDVFQLGYETTAEFFQCAQMELPNREAEDEARAAGWISLADQSKRPQKWMHNFFFWPNRDHIPARFRSKRLSGSVMGRIYQTAPEEPLPTKNPATAAQTLRAISEGSASAENFEGFYSQSAAETLEKGDAHFGRRSVWVGPRGKCVRIDPNYVLPMPGNQFDPDKLDAVAGAVRGGLEPPAGDERGRPVFFVGYGTVQIISERDVEESREAFDRNETWLDAPLEDEDVGELLYTVRDGNHRVFGALMGGETAIWMQLEANLYQDVMKWRRDGSTRSGPKGADDHQERLMEILSSMLTEDEWSPDDEEEG